MATIQNLQGIIFITHDTAEVRHHHKLALLIRLHVPLVRSRRYGLRVGVDYAQIMLARPGPIDESLVAECPRAFLCQTFLLQELIVQQMYLLSKKLDYYLFIYNFCTEKVVVIVLLFR